MDKEILYEILNSKSEKYSAEVIEEILNVELDKAPDEMDTDLVDLCLEALETVDEGQLNKKRHRIKFARVLTAAVVFILVIGVSIPAFAKLFNINVPEGVVNIYKNCFNIDLSNDEYTGDIFSQLEQDGFENVYLPNIVYSPSSSIYDYNCYSDNLRVFCKFSYSNNDVYGNVSINKYAENKNLSFSETDEVLEAENVEYFKNSNINGTISSDGKAIHIYYVENNIEYDFIIKGNMETASEIVDAFINQEV